MASLHSTWGGGETFARKVTALATAFVCPVAFHDCTGPMTLAVSTHLALACPNVVEQEIARTFHYGRYASCVDRLPRLENGYIRPGEGAGLGLSSVADITSRRDRARHAALRANVLDLTRNHSPGAMGRMTIEENIMSQSLSLGVVIHAPKDLRVDEVAVIAPGAGEVRVGIAAGGICGSDLHYYNHGGFGTVRIKEPMVLGHEIAGSVLEVGSGVRGISPGMRVAVNPSRPCGHCVYCRQGQRHQCLNMQFIGSAMRFPHAQGGFRQSLTVDAGQLVSIPDSMTMAEAAMAEPLAVCLHAASQAGPLQGRRVLVTGCGPIGMLSIIAAHHGGAAEIVVTDIADFPLSVASGVGASRTINILAEPEALAPYMVDKGYFDVHFEASGNEAALVGALEAMRPGGIVVQVGLGGDMKLPINLIVAREIQLRGTFRFDREFAMAVELMGRGLIDVKPLLTHTVPFRDAITGFTLAQDRSQAIKVQLAF